MKGYLIDTGYNDFRFFVPECFAARIPSFIKHLKSKGEFLYGKSLVDIEAIHCEITATDPDEVQRRIEKKELPDL